MSLPDPPWPLSNYPDSGAPASSARCVLTSCPVGTTQILPAPPVGCVWLVERLYITNGGAGAADWLVQDVDGPLGAAFAVAAAGFGSGQFLAPKAVSLVVVSNGPAVVHVVAYPVPAPSISLVFKPTDTYQTVPLVVPAGMVAVPAGTRLRGQGFVATPPPNLMRVVNADTSGALTTSWRISRGADSYVLSSSNARLNAVLNQSNTSATGVAYTSADTLEMKLSSAPVVPGSYAYRLVFDLLPAA